MTKSPIRQVLAALPGTMPEIAATTGLPEPQVARHLLDLRRSGYTIRAIMQPDKTRAEFVLEGEPPNAA